MGIKACAVVVTCSMEVVVVSKLSKEVVSSTDGRFLEKGRLPPSIIIVVGGFKSDR